MDLQLQVLLVVWTLNAIGTALMLVNESPLLASEVPSAQRASVFSFMMVNFFLWNTLGFQLSGFLAAWLPRGAHSPYEWPLVIAGVCGVTAGLVRALLPFKDRVQTRSGLTCALAGRP